MSQPTFDLRAAAHQEMIAEGFQPDFSGQVMQQVKTLEAQRGSEGNKRRAGSAVSTVVLHR